MTPDTLDRTHELGESVVAETRAVREIIDAEVGHDVRRLAQAASKNGEGIRNRLRMELAEVCEHRPPEGGKVLPEKRLS